MIFHKRIWGALKSPLNRFLVHSSKCSIVAPLRESDRHVEIKTLLQDVQANMNELKTVAIRGDLNTLRELEAIREAALKSISPQHGQPYFNKVRTALEPMYKELYECKMEIQSKMR